MIKIGLKTQSFDILHFFTTGSTQFEKGVF